MKKTKLEWTYQKVFIILGNTDVRVCCDERMTFKQCDLVLWRHKFDQNDMKIMEIRGKW